MVFNASIFKLYRGSQFYRWRKPDELEKTTDLSQVTLRFTTSDYPWDRRGRDRMVVGFTTTYSISAYHQ
jgi:hypothetical protein